MIAKLSTLLAGWTDIGPVLLAALVAAGLAALARRRAWLLHAACALAAASGWAALLPWRAALWPRGGVDHLLLPALVIGGAGIAAPWVKARWQSLGSAAFAGWWLAGSAAGRPEFWRVWFAAGAVAWLLGRGGAGTPGRASGVVLAVAGALALAAASPLWIVAAAVLLAAVCGMLVAGRAGVVPPALAMIFVVAAELGAGQAVRGGLGLVDFTCAGAVAAPWLAPRIERSMSRWLGRGAAVIAPVATAACVVAGAWVGARAWHGH